MIRQTGSESSSRKDEKKKEWASKIETMKYIELYYVVAQSVSKIDLIYWHVSLFSPIVSDWLNVCVCACMHISFIFGMFNQAPLKLTMSSCACVKNEEKIKEKTNVPKNGSEKTTYNTAAQDEMCREKKRKQRKFISFNFFFSFYS